MSDFKAETLPYFSPPGNLSELTEENRELWSKQFISYWMDGEISADPSIVSPGRTPLSQFFNGTVDPFDTTQRPQAVTWNAFPKLVTTAYKTTPLRWQVADASRIFQDEYLEWSASRNSSKDIISATFTCEGPEYWQFFASYQREDFIKKMRELNADAADSMSDNEFFLTDPKTGQQVYNPNNYWNSLTTTGTIAHLVQPNNTLSAEIDIAAQATVIRKDKDGNIVTDPDRLIRCSQYGNPGRHSDPTIGGAINQYARAGNALSVADPVALYIASIDTSNFYLDLASTTGDASNANLEPIDDDSSIFVFTRGDIAKGQGLRFTVKIPEGKLGKNGQQLNVSNIYDKKTKQHIRYAAQIADYVTMSVSAVTVNKGEAAEPVPCYGAEEAKAKAEKRDEKAAVSALKASGSADVVAEIIWWIHKISFVCNETVGPSI
ncbi:putative alpha-galactosidase B [Neofusicoccum parvum]|uniref:Alpha-galactosidase B n=1 Tax=Neofusicoccum parvum TaxID=310453 RepID=A0ACB5S1M0_9PEZI|nr:putative alpha-galactosidase B [Neofusicoccum parvum]